jgi:hypothetical protein
VKKYLADAKSAVEGSKSKENLLEAVENLGNALKEVQKARDFNAIKFDLNVYRRYCDRACVLLDETEKNAPGASRLIKKGLPIIDERIKQILAEIQEKAKALCKQVQGTPFVDLGKELNKSGQNLLKIENPITLDKELCKINFGLSSLYDRIPEEKRGDIIELLKESEKEEVIERRLNLINQAVPNLTSKNPKRSKYPQKNDLIFNSS